MAQCSARHSGVVTGDSGAMATMFQSIRALGDDMDARGNIRSGSILIDDITVAGD